MTLERRADARALGRGEVVVQQVVGPADRVQQVAGGEIGVRLVVGVAPRLVVDRRQRPRLRRREILGLALDGVGQRRLRRSRTRRRSASDVPAVLAPAAAPPSTREVRGHLRPSRRDASCARAREARRVRLLVTNTRGCTPTSSGLSATLCASSSSKVGTVSCANAGRATQDEPRTSTSGRRHDHHARLFLVRAIATAWIRPASASVTTKPERARGRRP